MLWILRLRVFALSVLVFWNSGCDLTEETSNIALIVWIQLNTFRFTFIYWSKIHQSKLNYDLNLATEAINLSGKCLLRSQTRLFSQRLLYNLTSFTTKEAALCWWLERMQVHINNRGCDCFLPELNMLGSPSKCFIRWSFFSCYQLDHFFLSSKF